MKSNISKKISRKKEAIRKSEVDVQAVRQRVKIDEETQKQLQQRLRAAQPQRLN